MSNGMIESPKKNGKQSMNGMGWEYDIVESFENAGLKIRPNKYLDSIRAARYSRNREWPRDMVYSYKHYARSCVDHILESQYPMKLTWVRADGGEGFRDVVAGDDEGTEIPVSAKHNSEEVYGPRMRARPEYLLKKQKSQQKLLTRYREDDAELVSVGLNISDDIADYLRKVLGDDWLYTNSNSDLGLLWNRHKDFSDSCVQKLRSGIRSAILRQQDRQEYIGIFFSEIIGSGDHYLVRKAGNKGNCYVIGYNFDGTLRVDRMTRPERITNVEYIDGYGVLATFSGGWQMKWRVHTRDVLIRPNGIGVSVTITGIPPKSHSILIKP